jgi:hypothetical protein
MDAALSVSPLSGHGVALALHGAELAAEDPVRYREWFLRTALDHAAEETRPHVALGRLDKHNVPLRLATAKIPVLQRWVCFRVVWDCVSKHSRSASVQVGGLSDLRTNWEGSCSVNIRPRRPCSPPSP